MTPLIAGQEGSTVTWRSSWPLPNAAWSCSSPAPCWPAPGTGVAFLAAQDNLIRIAPDGQRAEISAAFYVRIYLGVSLPVIGIGVVAVAATLFTAVATFGAVTGGAALMLAAWHLRHR